MNGSIKRNNERIRNMFTKKDGLSTDLSTIIPQRRSIIVIIVHFGNKKDTESLVESLRSNTRPPDDIIVVDNDEHNRGYLEGLKTGVRQSRQKGYYSGDLLVLLNNDSRAGVDFISEIEQWWDMHGSPTTLAGPILGTLSLVTGRAHIQSAKQGILRKRYVHGFCMVVERSFFDHIADVEDFFMYWEDVALSLRAVASEGVIRSIPGLSIHHDDSKEVVSDAKLHYLVRNGAYVLERLSFPWGAYWSAMNWARQAYHRLLGHKVIYQALVDRRNVL